MALSVDLRERVLAERFGIAVGTVNGWLRQARDSRRAPLRHRGGRAGLAGAGREDLTALVAERPDATLAERVGRPFSPAVLCRALQGEVPGPQGASKGGG
jgi:transposase